MYAMNKSKGWSA
jgi:translation initiation factor 4E